jgi:hypothetical protein
LIKDTHNINDTTATVMAQTENLEIKDTWWCWAKAEKEGTSSLKV